MKKILLILGFVTVLVACSSAANEGESSADNFDRTALLTHWANNIIVPSYQNYQTTVETLNASAASFNSNPTVNNLQALRSAWFNAYNAYQKVTAFYLGKAMDISLKEATNTYPTDAAGIDLNIASGGYNLELFSQFSRQGFPALDYLINGLGPNDAAIVTFYTTNANAANYKLYVAALTAKLKTNIDLIVSDWTTGYTTSYIASNGNAVSSSVNKTTNLFVKNLEKDIRSGKIGIPAGIFSSGRLFPEKVEGFYKKDISKTLLNTALQAQQDFFNGKNFNNNLTGPSLKSYLDYLNAVRNGQSLSAIINNQFAAVFVANATLNGDFSAQVNTDNTKMIAAYNVLQQAVIYSKLDMMQALSISIDYVDGDGD